MFVNVTSMPNSGQYGTFSNCTSLQTVILPPKLTSLSTATFTYCTSLKKVVFHEGYKTLVANIFYRGSNNVILDLPASLTTINSNVYEDTHTLIFVLRGNVGTFDGIKNTSKTAKIYAADEYLTNYQTYLTGNANLSKLYPLSEYDG